MGKTVSGVINYGGPFTRFSILVVHLELSECSSTFNTHISTLLSWAINASTCILLMENGRVIIKIPAGVQKECRALLKWVDLVRLRVKVMEMEEYTQ